MVDEAGTQSGSHIPHAAGPRSSLRREKPIIEGEIASEEKAAPDAEIAPAAAETVAPIDEPPAPDAGEPQAEHVAAASPRDAEPRRRSSAVWPIAAAIVIGAGLAVAGAYLLHGLDTAPDDIAALSARQSDLGARLTALEKKPDAGAGLREALSAQDKRLAAVEAATREAIAAAKTAQAAAAAATVAAQAAAAQAGTAAPAAASEASQAQQPPAVDLSPLTTQIGALDQRLGTLDDKIAKLSAPLVPKNEMRLAEDSTVQPSAHIEVEAAAIIAESLVGKVERGAAFAPELAALANRGADKGKLALLEPAAQTGVATTHALAAQFSAFSPDLLAVQPTKPEDSFLDRLTQNAGKLIHVRKIGDLSGTELPARVGRINAALQGGGVEEALAQWNDLPATAKAKSQAFADAAKLRLDAISAAHALETDAIAALAKTKS